MLNETYIANDNEHTRQMVRNALEIVTPTLGTTEIMRVELPEGGLKMRLRVKQGIYEIGMTGLTSLDQNTVTRFMQMVLKTYTREVISERYEHVKVIAKLH